MQSALRPGRWRQSGGPSTDSGPQGSRAAGRGRLVQPVSDTALNRTTAKAQTCRLQGHAGPAGRSSLTPSYPHRGAPGPACRLWPREGWQAASPGWTAWHLGPSTRPRSGTGPCPLLGDHSRGTPTLSGTLRPHHVSPGQAVVCPPGGVVCPQGHDTAHFLGCFSSNKGQGNGFFNGPAELPTEMPGARGDWVSVGHSQHPKGRNKARSAQGPGQMHAARRVSD